MARLDTARYASVSAFAGTSLTRLTTARDDATANLSESFTYDPLNRLLTATVASNVPPQKTFSYDAIGNMLSKSDVGTYTYPAPGQPRPHAAMIEHRK